MSEVTARLNKIHNGPHRGLVVFIALDIVDLKDELSNDAVDWHFIGDIPDPKLLRGDATDGGVGIQGKEHEEFDDLFRVSAGNLGKSDPPGDPKRGCAPFHRASGCPDQRGDTASEPTLPTF